MAQTKKKRSRKRRGTPAGTVERPVRRTGAKGNQDPKKTTAAARRAERLDREPTWRGSVNRAAIAAAVFGVLVIAAFGRPVVAGVTLAAFMFVLYIPLGYMTDRAVYNFRRRKRQ
jgi:Flp pilus assembly protein TadB